MTKSNANMTPLHKTVRDADVGDVGWVWWNDRWCPAQIVDVEDEGECVCVVDDNMVEWLSIQNDDAFISSALWFPILRPPYEGNERPSTHRVVMDGGSATVTIAWQMQREAGEEILSKVARSVHELLHPEVKT